MPWTVLATYATAVALGALALVAGALGAGLLALVLAVVTRLRRASREETEAEWWWA